MKTYKQFIKELNKPVQLLTKPLKPIPGKDGRWIALCKCCDDMKLFVSRGGLKNGGVEHCCSCGNERLTTGMKQGDIDRVIISAKYHWMKFPIEPYKTI